MDTTDSKINPPQADKNMTEREIASILSMKGINMASSIKSKKVMIWAGFISVFLMVCVTAFAADPNDPNAVNIADQKQEVVTKVAAVDENQAPAKEVALKKEVLSTIEQRMQKRISVDFRNTPIEDVIRIMAEQVGVDIIKSPNVTGNVTATLTNAPLQEALDNILAAHGYGYIASENMIRIAPTAELAEKSEKLVNKIYRITYADVTEVEKSLKNFMSPRGSVSANPGTSNIIVTDSESKIKAIDTFIQEVDRITPQILVEARIYDITSTDRFDLGIEWDVGRATTFDADTHEPTAGAMDPFIKGGFNGTVQKTNNTTGALRFGFLNSSLDIDAILRAQQEKINAKLLANPRVMVLDNQKAEFKIVRQIPYQQLNQGGGTSVAFGTTEFKEVGVTLEVVPHLTRDGMIRLKLKPKFSVQNGSVNVGDASGAKYPQPVIDERNADTVLLVQDGRTVVLGGLRKKEVSKQNNKIPLLGDLPLAGALFRFEGEETINSELVVFVTPRIIEQPALSQNEALQLEVTEFPGPKVSNSRAEDPNYK